ncbi:MAG TPA: fused response regulator/phosphatase, partial [Sedimenticola sp.]|nr:fused response regulator/phosphatase [Sedimenticola sp.]
MQTAWNSASPTAGPAPQQRGTALVADDEHSNRQILRHLLERHHYRVILAADGARALELFEREHPDIVFIDTRMPVMDGYQVVARLRQQEPGPPVVPIVFLTDLTDRTALRRCIEAGGDDFLTKPFSPVLLEAKLLTMQRLGLLQHRIGRLYSRMKQDEAAAENVFSGAVVAENVAMDQLQTLLRPAEVFSGDVLLSAYSPAGDLNLILGDFTGHGLAAALGALPASEVFRAMTGKGFSPREILGGINRKLHALLPTGMFFAVQFLSIDRSLEKITVCNCGMPDILLLDGHGSRIKHRFASRSLPLSITAELDFQEPLEHYPIEAGDRVLLLSDGVVEARNEHNGYFGRERLEAAILQRRPGEGALDNVVEALDGFCGDAPQDDDISLAEVPCLPDLLPQWADLPATGEGTEEAEVSQQDALTFSLTLSGQRLRETDPVPLLIN